MMNAPELANRGAYLVRESSLSPKIRELAMLVTAREHDCQYIWNAHAPLGRKAGLSDETVDHLRDRRELTKLVFSQTRVVRCYTG